MWHSASRLFAIAVFVVCTTPLAEAQRSDQQLIVLSAVADRTSQTLTIRGMNFGSSVPSIWYEDQSMTVLTGSETELVVMLPSTLEVLSTLNPSPPVSVASFGTLTGTATCPAGKRAIAGGFESAGGAVQMLPTSSFPNTESSWRVVLRNTTGGSLTNAQVRVHVVCAPAS